MIRTRNRKEKKTQLTMIIDKGDLALHYVDLFFFSKEIEVHKHLAQIFYKKLFCDFFSWLKQYSTAVQISTIALQSIHMEKETRKHSPYPSNLCPWCWFAFLSIHWRYYLSVSFCFLQ